MSIDEQLHCDRCGNALTILHEGHAIGTFCPRCGQSVMTTHIPAIRLDQTRYSMRLTWEPTRKSTVAQIQTLANATGVNVVAARRLLGTHTPLVFEGVALEILRVRDLLHAVGFNVAIEPNFNY